MMVALRQSLRIVATPQKVHLLCNAKRTMADLERKGTWTEIEEARYKKARSVVRRGLG